MAAVYLVSCSGGESSVDDAPYGYLDPARDIDVFFALIDKADEETAAHLAVVEEARADCQATPLAETQAEYLRHVRRDHQYMKQAAVLALEMLESGDPYFADMMADGRPVDRLGGATLREFLILMPVRIGVLEVIRSDYQDINKWRMRVC